MESSPAPATIETCEPAPLFVMRSLPSSAFIVAALPVLVMVSLLSEPTIEPPFTVLLTVIAVSFFLPRILTVDKDAAPFSVISPSSTETIISLPLFWVE